MVVDSSLKFFDSLFSFGAKVTIDCNGKTVVIHVALEQLDVFVGLALAIVAAQDWHTATSNGRGGGGC